MMSDTRFFGGFPPLDLVIAKPKRVVPSWGGDPVYLVRMVTLSGSADAAGADRSKLFLAYKAGAPVARGDRDREMVLGQLAAGNIVSLVLPTLRDAERARTTLVNEVGHAIIAAADAAGRSVNHA